MRNISSAIVTTLFVLAATLSGAQAECTKWPEIKIDTTKVSPGPSSQDDETLVVDGKVWTSRYTRVVRIIVLDDCGVAIVGRRELSNFIVVNDVPWQHGVFNSGRFEVSDDNQKILQYDEAGAILVNDVVQPSIPIRPGLKGRLAKADFTSDNRIMSIWRFDDSVVIALDGEIIYQTE